MRLYRRGGRYMVYLTADRVFMFNSYTGETTPERAAAEMIARHGNAWRLVFDDEPLPDALIDKLIYKFPDKQG